MEIHYSRSSRWILSADILHENIRQKPAQTVLDGFLTGVRKYGLPSRVL